MAKPKLNPVTLDLRSVMNEVADQVNKDLAKQLRVWSRNVGRNVTRGEGLRSLNQDMAAKARSRVIGEYNARGIGYRKSYRQNDRRKWRRYSNGRLMKALEDPEVIKADERGIHYVDIDLMDKWAKQWYRLNFGTKGGNNRRAPSAKPMTFFGVPTSARVSLDQWGPSSSFRVPKGFFSGTFAAKTAGTKLIRPNGVGQDAFYAARKDKRSRAIPSRNTPFFAGKNSADIDGQRFLDAGTRYINAYYGRRFTALAKKWLRN